MVIYTKMTGRLFIVMLLSIIQLILKLRYLSMNFNKPTKIRSKKIRQSSKGECCKFRIPGVCNHNPETVVFCHAPSPHKGTASKSDDFWGADGCSDCHAYMDRY